MNHFQWRAAQIKMWTQAFFIMVCHWLARTIWAVMLAAEKHFASTSVCRYSELNAAKRSALHLHSKFLSLFFAGCHICDCEQSLETMRLQRQKKRKLSVWVMICFGRHDLPWTQRVQYSVQGIAVAQMLCKRKRKPNGISKRQRLSFLDQAREMETKGKDVILG